MNLEPINKNPKTVNELSSNAMLKLAKQLINDWKLVAQGFPDIIDGTAIELIDSSNEYLPKPERFLMRLRERSVPLVHLYKILYDLNLESSCAIIENEVSKDTVESFKKKALQSQNKMQPFNYQSNQSLLSKGNLTSNTSQLPFQFVSQFASTPQPQQQHQQSQYQQQQQQQSLLINESFVTNLSKDSRLFDPQPHLKSIPSTNPALQQSLQPSLINQSDFLSSFSTLNISQPPPPLNTLQQQQQLVKLQQSQNNYDLPHQNAFYSQTIPPNINDVFMAQSQYQSMQHSLNQQKQFVSFCEAVFPVIKVDEVDEVSNSNSYAGKFTVVEVRCRGLKCLKSTFSNFNDYVQELNSIKHKHENIFAPEMIVKGNELSLLYPKDIQYSLSEYISHIYRSEKHLLLKLSILKGIASGLSFLHSKYFYYGNINNDSILIQPVSDTKVVAKLSDFKNSTEFGTDNSKPLNDLYNFGLIVFEIYTYRTIRSFECEQYHNICKNYKNDEEKRNYKFDLMAKFMPTTNNLLEKDIYKQLFVTFWNFTSSDQSRDKLNLEKLINKLESYQKDIKAEMEKQQQQVTSVWPIS